MKRNNVIRTMIEIALFAAIGFVLDELQGAIAVSFPNGGSIGIAMVAVLIVAYRRGCLPGVLTGLIIGLFDIATKAYILHPLQVLCDYILPYALVGLAGLLKPFFDHAPGRKEKILWLISGAVIGGLLKLTSHFIAGVVWWGDPEYFAWGLNNWNVYLYSLVYNIAFIFPSIILSGALLVILLVKAPVIFEAKESKSKKAKEINERTLAIAFSSFLLALGLFLFTYFFIKYIQSFTWKESSSKYTFDQDSMVIFITGIALIFASIAGYVMIKWDVFEYRHLLFFIIICLGLHSLYALGHIIEMYIEQEIENYYWAWFAFATAFISLPVLFIIKEKKNSSSSQD